MGVVSEIRTNTEHIQTKSLEAQFQTGKTWKDDEEVGKTFTYFNILLKRMGSQNN